ncbi:MAG TPA: glycoside hydrolase 43 family protein [Polyangiaceae bacterium]|nr:glycoside hydrolase 43 family protein [Polyangiaceae bacterium]
MTEDREDRHCVAMSYPWRGAPLLAMSLISGMACSEGSKNNPDQPAEADGGRSGSASSAGGRETTAGAAGSVAISGAGSVGAAVGGATSVAGSTSNGGSAAGAGAGGNGGGSALGGGGAGGTGAGAGAGGAYTGPWPPAATFKNPVLWQDLADDEVIRVDDTYYYTASNMHYSPGAPILRSYDLVNWEYAGHAIPVLDFASKYDLSGGQAYIKGTWASTLQYRKSNKTFYWLGCIEFSKTYVYTATAVEGPWQKHPPIGNCYYDAGMMIDDDDKMYVAYGNTKLSVAELSADGFSQVKTQEVYAASGMTLEGSHFFKRGGSYYITPTRPADGEFVLKSSSPWGPYTIKPLIDKNTSPVSGAGVPHQGSLVETASGDWYYMAFIDAYPGGRSPVLAPVTWSDDGWPTVQLVGKAWAAEYPYPNVPRPPRAMKPPTGIDTFTGSALGPEWEWNHNPDNSKWSLGAGLKLQTATVTSDLYKARNTLTHRILGPQSTGTIELDVSDMKDGDVAGLALLRHFSAYIAVEKSGAASKVVMVNGLAMDGSWNTTSTGTEAASATFEGTKLWLRLSADIRPGANRQGSFSYSTDGTTFKPLGPGYTMNNSWEFFMGYRFGIFNFATTALGGAVTVKSFELTSP